MAWTSFLLSLQLLYRRVGILLTGNVLWLMLSLFIIPLPAATAGLFYLVYRVVQEERHLDPEYAKIGDFWKGVRLFGWRATVLFVLDAFALVLIATTFRFYWLSDVELFRWLMGPVALIGLVWAASQLYLFPFFILDPYQSPFSLARRAVLTAIGYPLDSVLLLTWLLIATVICTLLAGPIFLVYFAFLALAQTMMLRMVRIARHEIEPARLPED